MAEIINSSKEFVESLSEGTERVLTGSFALIADDSDVTNSSVPLIRLETNLPLSFTGLPLKKVRRN